MMINATKLAELRKIQNFSKFSWIYGTEIAKEILDTIEFILKENKVLRDRFDPCAESGELHQLCQCVQERMTKLEAVAKAAEDMQNMSRVSPNLAIAIAALRENGKEKL